MRAAAALVLAVAALLGASAEETPAGEAGGTRLAVYLALDYDYRYRSSRELVENYEYKSGIDLQRNFFDVPPFASFGLEIGGERGFGAALGANLRRELATIGYFKDDNLPLNGSSGYALAFERPFLSRGALWWRGERCSVELGRDKSDYGKEIEGSLYPSGRLPYLDALKARVDIGPFRVDWMVSTIHAVESWDGVDVDPNEGLNEADYPIGCDPQDLPYGFYDDENPTTILDALHRFSYRRGALELGVGANVIYARRNNWFLVTDFLPVSSWHQTQVLSNNLTLYLDATWRPSAELTIAAEAGFDDIDASAFGVPDSGVPTIDAYVLGARYAGALAAGKLTAYLEAGYTHYLWGNYDGRSDEPYDEDPLARAQYRFLVVNGSALLPLTSPYGPGAAWCKAECSLTPAGSRLGLGLSLLLLSKNAEANLVDTAYDTSAADGARILFLSASLRGSYSLGAFTAYAEPGFCWRDGTPWLECSAGLRLELAAERRL